MTEQEWMERLDALVRALAGFDCAEWSERVSGAVRIRVENSKGRRAVAVLLKSEAVVDHLAAGAGCGDRVVFVASADRNDPGTPQLLLRDGKVMIVSSEDEPGDPEPPTDFATWFEHSFGRRFPLDAAGMQCIGQDVWADQPASIEEVTGFPHSLEISGRKRYRLVGYAGYGSNSWACYYTDVRPGCSILLRLPFGGAYGDPDRDADHLVKTVAACDALAREVLEARMVDELELTSNMGAMGAWLRKLGVGESLLSGGAAPGFLDEVRAEAARIAAGVARNPGAIDRNDWGSVTFVPEREST